MSHHGFKESGHARATAACRPGRRAGVDRHRHGCVACSADLAGWDAIGRAVRADVADIERDPVSAERDQRVLAAVFARLDAGAAADPDMGAGFEQATGGGGVGAAAAASLPRIVLTRVAAVVVVAAFAAWQRTVQPPAAGELLLLASTR